MSHCHSLQALSCLVLALAQPPAPSGTPVFVLHTASKDPVQGPLQCLDEQWSVSLAGPQPSRVEGSDFIALRRPDTVLPPPPTGPHVIFANGDRLPGQVIHLAEERLVVATDLGKEAEQVLPLSALSAVWIADPADVDQPDRLRRRLLSERRSQDVVWLRNGDQLQGNLVGFDRAGVRLEVARKEVKIERDKVAVLALNNELARTLRPAGSYGYLVLTDGTRLGLLAAQADRTLLRGKTLFGGTIEVAINRVVALDLRQGKAVYLSDLKPASYQSTPFLPGLEFACGMDASVAGNDLRLGGSTYVKGLGMHSPSRITYTLKGEYQRLEAWVGLDDRTGRKGSVRVKVLADGKPCDLGWDKELTVHDGAQPVRVSVAGVQELTLVVESGRFPFVQGHVTWADARLIKAH